MNILLNCQSGIGINILAVPTLRAVKRRDPGGFVHLVVQFETGRELLKECPYVDCISVVNYDMVRRPRSLAAFIGDLRRISYDYSFLMFPANRLDKNLFHAVVKARKKFTHDYGYRGFMRGKFLNDVRVDVDYDAHDVVQNLNLLEAAGIDPAGEKTGLELFLTEEEKVRGREMADRIGKGKKLVGIHAGSSRDLTMELKRWPSRSFARLADRLKERYECEILLFGSRDEDIIKKRIETSMEHGCRSIHQMDIRTTAALIGNCSLFISNDSGLMHIAAAAGVETVGIFGPTDPVRTAPYGSNGLVVRSGIDCSPCFSIRTVGKEIRCIHEERKCLTELDPDRVFDLMSEVSEKALGSGARTPS